MWRWPRIAIVWLCCIFTLGACGSEQSLSPASSSGRLVSSPTTTIASATALQPAGDSTLTPDAQIAGINVGGLTGAAATAKLQEELTVINRPLELRTGTARMTLRPEDIDLQAPVEDLVAEALRQAENGEPVRVDLEITLDEAALRNQLNELAATAAVTPTISLITSTETLSRTFAYTPGQSLDFEKALQQVEEHLRSPQATQRLTLDLESDPATPQVSREQIREQVEAMAAEWDGIVGFYLHNLTDGETITLNENTVFSGASVMKVPILLQAYINLEEFDEEQQQWLREMIEQSDNLSANDLLAASVDGQGTEDALVGARAMNDMLRDLGLEHTYQNLPYEAYDYLVTLQGIPIQSGPAQEGALPYTEADPLVRTTPAEMSQVFLWIDQCSKGEGILLERFESTLNAERCQEMLDRLEANEDATRLVSGIPEGVRVEHKSGWVEDMQADVGIVRSPGGDFLLAVYLYQKNDWLRDHIAAPVIGAFAHMVYTAYNPVELAQDE
ncbi:MAG: class A beta-lactamase-related serine hydrolase [Chloroflexales bacterium]|nr:class A beta-lactamase-related serine hydrolase [Chloroflexales bacterium]